MADAGPTDRSSPPIANRGVYPHAEGDCPVPHFDWYGATVHAHYSTVLDHLEQAFLDAGEDTKRVEGGAVKHYAGITFIQDAQGRKLAQVKHGGSQPNPHAEAEGVAAPIAAAALRSMREEHFVTRVDSAMDLTAEGLFEHLHDLARALEAEFGLHLNYAGAALDNRERGTTIYLGSKKSQVFLRIYQKGLQIAEMQEMHRDAITPELRNWVRSELVFRPQKKRIKAFGATVTPGGVWGVSTWSQRFAKDALSIDAERVNVNQRRESNHQRALRYMAHQYRSHLDQLLRDCDGDYAEAMAVLVDLAGLSDQRDAA